MTDISIYILSDRYCALKYPAGLKNGKADLEPDWAIKERSLFITHTCGPVKKVDLREFSELSGILVKAGDLRKIFCTELGNTRSGYDFLRILSRKLVVHCKNA